MPRSPAELLLLDRRPSARRAMLLVWIAAVLAIIGLFSAVDAQMRIAALLGAAVFLAASAVPISTHLRLKKRDAPGLQLDQTGISGQLAPGSLQWRDIAGFGLVRSISGKTSIGVTLNTPHHASADPENYDLRLKAYLLAQHPTDILARLQDWHMRQQQI